MKTITLQPPFCKPERCNIENCSKRTSALGLKLPAISKLQDYIGEKVPAISKPQDYDMAKITRLLQVYRNDFLREDIAKFVDLMEKAIIILSKMARSENNSDTKMKYKTLKVEYDATFDNYNKKRGIMRELTLNSFCKLCEHEYLVQRDLIEAINTYLVPIATFLTLQTQPQNPEATKIYLKSIMGSREKLAGLNANIKDGRQFNIIEFGLSYKIDFSKPI